jgi:uncharacterized membrane protein YbhN (UPF0104 family)
MGSFKIHPTVAKYLKLVLKIAFSGAALYFVASKTDLHSLWLTINKSNGWLLLLAVGIYVASQIVSAFRLDTLFKCLPLRIGTLNNIKLYWLGLFYNIFLPGGVGGDGFKVYLINKYRHTPVRKLVGVVLSDRVSGLSVILVYLLGLVHFINYQLPYQGWLWALIPTVGLVYYLFLYLFNRSLTPSYWKVAAWSFIVQGLQVLTAILIIEAIGAGVIGHRDDFIFLFLLSAITASVPITLGGIGARELTLLTGAEMLGLDQNHAVALSLIFYVISVVVALPGLIYTFAPAPLVQEEAVDA